MPRKRGRSSFKRTKTGRFKGTQSRSPNPTSPGIPSNDEDKVPNDSPSLGSNTPDEELPKSPVHNDHTYFSQNADNQPELGSSSIVSPSSPRYRMASIQGRDRVRNRPCQRGARQHLSGDPGTVEANLNITPGDVSDLFDSFLKLGSMVEEQESIDLIVETPSVDKDSLGPVGESILSDSSNPFICGQKEIDGRSTEIINPEEKSQVLPKDARETARERSSSVPNPYVPVLSSANVLEDHGTGRNIETTRAGIRVSTRLKDVLSSGLPGDVTTKLPEAHEYIVDNLPEYWMCLPAADGFNLVKVSSAKELAIQRRIFCGLDGSVEASVHTKPLQSGLLQAVLSKAPPAVHFTSATSEKFAKRAVALACEVNRFTVCCGVDSEDFRNLWNLASDTSVVDRNPYCEAAYTETCRAKSCPLLVESHKKRCSECSNLKTILRKKRRSHQGSEFHPCTKNIYLDDTQKLAKLKVQHDSLRLKEKQIGRLKAKIKELVAKDGVPVDVELHDFLMESLENAKSEKNPIFEKYSPLQRLFLAEQLKAKQAKRKSSVRWHPAMIRFALLIRSLSKSAYSAIAGTGMIQLPSERTLFEYSHVTPAEEGVQTHKLEKIADRVKTAPHPYQKNFILKFDEMHISKNLVFRKGKGEIIGYVKLSNVEQEILDLEKFLQSDDGVVNSSPPIATQMLSFLLKGVANDVKEVVAMYTTCKLTQCQLYSRFWEVVVQAEKRGICVVAAVCDGSSVNRAFIKMHEPYTKMPNKLVFDTLNLCAPDGRLLYFISDPPHLIKTVRNCFLKSGYGPKCTRVLTLNGERIVWQTIVAMYEGERTKNWRRCSKLNAQNVYLNSYSVMKVSYAAQVLSNTVATDLKSLGWADTAETVKFIKGFNDFFDMLNGAFSRQDVRTRNPNLAAYTSVRDERFQKLMDFLDYLNAWKKQVKELEGYTTEEKNKMLLSRETLEGIEITIRGFCAATKFLLKVGTKFVNARVFCSDDIEQYHSKQRFSVGGSTNPNVQQFLHTDQKVSVLREMSDMSVRYRKGNVKAPTDHFQVSSEPVPKRKKT